MEAAQALSEQQETEQWLRLWKKNGMLWNKCSEKKIVYERCVKETVWPTLVGKFASFTWNKRLFCTHEWEKFNHCMEERTISTLKKNKSH